MPFILKDVHVYLSVLKFIGKSAVSGNCIECTAGWLSSTDKFPSPMF